VAIPTTAKDSNPRGKLMLYHKEGATELFAEGTWQASHNVYVEFSPDGRHLFVTSYGGVTRKGELEHLGLDVYRVTAPKNTSAYGRTASIYHGFKRGEYVPVGGLFEVTPDGAHLVFHNGTILKVATLADNVAAPPSA